MAREWIGELVAQLNAGKISRREFVRRAGALGLSAALIGQALRVAEVRAQDASPAAGGGTVGRTDVPHITDTGKGTIKFYSSWPMIAASEQIGGDSRESVRMALEDFGMAAGGFALEYEALDDAIASTGSWDAGKESENANRAVNDEDAMVYIGTYNSGAAAISIPILNAVPMAMISPANTYPGLTQAVEGVTEEGEPDKYYPTGFRNYVRIVPKDTIQGAALATLMQEEGCSSIYILNDKEVYGAGLSRNIEKAAKDLGLEVQANDGIDPKAPNYRSVAAGITADCFVFSGITANNAAQLFKDVAAAKPDVKLFGPDGVAESGFADPKEGGIPADVAKKTLVTVATLDPKEYPPEGQKFFEDFSAKYGEKNPDPYAIYGYEAMKLALDAIKRAGDKGNDREEVVKQLFATQGRQSVLGTYDIDDNGDTTLTDYGIYKIEGGELKFDRTIKAQAG